MYSCEFAQRDQIEADEIQVEEIHVKPSRQNEKIPCTSKEAYDVFPTELCVLPKKMPFDRYNDMFVLSKEPHSNPKGAVCFIKKSLRVDCDEIQAACLWWGNV